MSQPCFVGSDGMETRRSAAALRAVDGLAFMATPIFAMMALLTGLFGGGAAGLCSGAPMSPLGGMGAMYLLMSAFHAAPWLKLIFGTNRARPA